VESVLFFGVFFLLFLKLTKGKEGRGWMFLEQNEGSGKKNRWGNEIGQLLTKGPVEVQLGGA
jgi:hypothetical protein